MLLKDPSDSHECAAGQVAKATRPEKLLRLSALDLLTALDGQLRASAGFGLRAFRPAPSDLRRQPQLVMLCIFVANELNVFGTAVPAFVAALLQVACHSTFKYYPL